MSKPYKTPTGRLTTKRRLFEEVVRDIRHTVFSVIRLRPTGVANTFDTLVLGSGFFVSSRVFLTCYHVVNPLSVPHQDGDWYQLVANAGNGNNPVIHNMQNVQTGVNLYLHPDADLALLQFPVGPDRPYVALDYGATPEGREIGVAGYPLGRLATVGGQPAYNQLIFRVAKGVVTASYSTAITDEYGTLNDVPVVEVNFMFVPGNSGGPVFDANTGRVVGFVKSFNTEKIIERVEQVTKPELLNLPSGLGPHYIDSFHALYSFSIKMERARPHIETLGVAP
jgi:S1-C subfamily serine protease